MTNGNLRRVLGILVMGLLYGSTEPVQAGKDEVNQPGEKDMQAIQGFYTSVLEFGAKGDGVTDDTEAIQKAINHVYARGGGTVYFPFTRKGYRLAKPAAETVDGKPCKSQLYISSESDPMQMRNICLQGEMPVKQIYGYQVRTGTERWPGTEFPMKINNCVLFSDWEAPVNTNAPEARPWALISVLGGSPLAFGLDNLTVRNLEFRVLLDTDRMYPTSSAANFKDVSRLIVEDCYFGLSKNVGSASQKKALLANPSYCAGLIASADQNDHQAFRSVGVQGFKYGFVFGEHVMADYLLVHDCEEGIVFHDSSHLSHIHHVVAQHNKMTVSALRQDTFGLAASRNIYFQIDSIDFEPGEGNPEAYHLQYGVFDPDNRMHAKITAHCGYPAASTPFPVCGGDFVQVQQFEWDGPPFFINWQVAGPFTDRDVSNAKLPEKGLVWRAPNSTVGNMVRPQDVDASPKPGIFYLRTAVTVPKASKFKLAMGADSPYRVWVNGKETVMNLAATNPCGVDKYLHPVEFQAGRNEIVVAFDGREGKGYGIRARCFAAPDGKGLRPESMVEEKP